MSGAGWIGRLEVGDGWARWSGAVGESSLHRHFAALAVSAAEPIVVHDERGRPTRARRILIEPLAPHRVAGGIEAELLFVEPTARAPALAGLDLEVRDSPVLAEGRSRAFWVDREGGPHGDEGRPDERLREVLAAIDAALADGQVRLEQAARLARLSPDRFRHVFADQIGLPFRRYLLWRRLATATHAIHVGAGVTEAASRAGFADAAHLARVVRATFGIHASQLFGSTTDQPRTVGSADAPRITPAS